MDRIKNNWSAYLSVIAIVCSIVAICVALPGNRVAFGMDYIGVLVGVLSLLVTILIGWQIWSIISIDKKIKGEVDKASNNLIKDIEKAREDLAISGVRSSVAILYKAESINLNMCLLAGKSNQIMAINTLQILLHYAISLNDNETLSDIARLIIRSKQKIYSMGITIQDYEKIRNSFLVLSQSVLTQLSASDVQVPALLQLINELTNEKTQPTK